MRGQLFLNLLRTSAVAGVAILALLAVSPLWNRHFGALWKKRLWCLLGAVLVAGAFFRLPEGQATVEITVPQRQVAVFRSVQGATGPHLRIYDPDSVTAVEPGTDLGLLLEQAGQTPSTPAPSPAVVEQSGKAVDVMTVLELLWALGAAAFLLRLAVREFLFRRQMRRWESTVKDKNLIEIYDNICQKMGIQSRRPALMICPGIVSPVLAGLLWPKLLLPTEDYTATEAEYILRHELSHWQSRDLWWKLLLLVANALHWFNPAAWLLRREADRDMERACDDQVMEGADDAARRAYGEVLLSAIRRGGAQPALSTCFRGSARVMRERLRNILTGAKRRGMALAVACGVLAACAVPLVSCTQNVHEEAPDSQGAEMGEMEQNPEDFYTILLLGTTEETGNCDTVMLAAYDRENQKLTIMSIPRDTMVDVPWEVKKLSSVYGWYGGGQAGVDAVKDIITGLLGFAPDYTVAVACGALEKLVDAMGGVPYDVPVDMDYEDPMQDLSIHLKQGPQVLDGKAAVGLVRWRMNSDLKTAYPGGDLDRVETQQSCLAAAMGQLLQVRNMARLGELAEILKENAVTDLSVGNLLWLARSAVLGGLSAQDIRCVTMPNTPVSCWSQTYQANLTYVVPIGEALRDLVNEALRPDGAEVSLENMNIPTIDGEGTVNTP